MSDNSNRDVQPSCATPVTRPRVITLAHGSGGRIMHDLIQDVFIGAFGGQEKAQRHDGAVLDMATERIAFTTDSYVVDPLFFPGGDIGKLAVCGTVNDLAMCGARPRWMSVAFILEEGLQIKTLERIALSMRDSADHAGVSLVTGDTKVVEKGRGHKVFITTAGIGSIDHGLVISPDRIRAGDAVVLSGDIGRHGIAVISSRQGLSFETEITSDCAALGNPVMALLEAEIEIHCMRDLTRGGLATSLVEIAESANMGIQIAESRIPVSQPVRAACELLGFDPMYVANEGRFVAFVPQTQADQALSILRTHGNSQGAELIGEVTGNMPTGVTLLTSLGTQRPIHMLSGEQFPRIC